MSTSVPPVFRRPPRPAAMRWWHAPSRYSRPLRPVNRALAQARAPVERGMERVKSWQIFRRSRGTRGRQRDAPRPDACGPRLLTFPDTLSGQILWTFSSCGSSRPTA
jgi:hypothetical protein